MYINMNVRTYANEIEIERKTEKGKQRGKGRNERDTNNRKEARHTDIL